MSLRTGVDMIEVHRLRAAIGRHGERFLRRIYTARELEQLNGNLPSLAARFAAKEAVAKALGTGIGDLSWLEVEILRGERKEPVLQLHGAAQTLAAQHGITSWSISISHTHEHAIAFVVAL
ncbi:MAG: holo-ACP synthase [Anaerolineales bacterium]|nr:holo-ACP synthase [Anaerolineales bacterium]QYK51291.1 MAG: holo-ACP synthase [Anaerolineales bacterium]